MNKFVFSLILTFAFFFIPQIIQADVINPDFMKANCKDGEQLVECFNGRNLNPTVARTQDECMPYRFNPAYRQLTAGNMTSDHGNEKFCFKQSTLSKSVIDNISQIAKSLSLTLIIELPILFFFGFKNIKVIGWAITANIISLPIMYLLQLFLFSLPFAGYWGLWIVILLEVLVMLFETIFLSKTAKVYDLKGTALVVVIANVMSALLGTIISSLF